jgi:hypothetical protein
MMVIFQARDVRTKLDIHVYVFIELTIIHIKGTQFYITGYKRDK